MPSPRLGDLSVPKRFWCHVALPKPNLRPRAPRQPRRSCRAPLPHLGDTSEVPSLHRGSHTAAAPNVAAGQDLDPPQRAPRWLLAPAHGSAGARECDQTTPTGLTVAPSPSCGASLSMTNPTWCDVSSVNLLGDPKGVTNQPRGHEAPTASGHRAGAKTPLGAEAPLDLKVAQGMATSLSPALCPRGGVCPGSAPEPH